MAEITIKRGTPSGVDTSTPNALNLTEIQMLRLNERGDTPLVGETVGKYKGDTAKALASLFGKAAIPYDPEEFFTVKRLSEIFSEPKLVLALNSYEDGKAAHIIDRFSDGPSLTLHGPILDIGAIESICKLIPNYRGPAAVQLSKEVLIFESMNFDSRTRLQNPAFAKGKTNTEASILLNSRKLHLLLEVFAESRVITTINQQTDVVASKLVHYVAHTIHGEGTSQSYVPEETKQKAILAAEEFGLPEVRQALEKYEGGPHEEDVAHKFAYARRPGKSEFLSIEALQRLAKIYSEDSFFKVYTVAKGGRTVLLFDAACDCAANPSITAHDAVGLIMEEVEKETAAERLREERYNNLPRFLRE